MQNLKSNKTQSLSVLSRVQYIIHCGGRVGLVRGKVVCVIINTSFCTYQCESSWLLLTTTTVSGVQSETVVYLKLRFM